MNKFSESRFAGWITRLLIMLCAATATQAAVTLTDNGTTVTLANGLVSATLLKSDGTVTDFRVGGSPDLTGSKGFYYTTHVVSDGVDSWVSISAGEGSTYSVTTNTSEIVDISIRNPTLGYDSVSFPDGMFDVDMHFVMRDGVAGIYKYMVWRHHADQPAAGLYQQRTIVADTSLADMGTTYTYCGGEVWNQAPGDAQDGADYIYDSTYELSTTNSYTYPTGAYYRDGWPIYYTLNPAAMIGLNYNLNPVYTKYDWSVYAGPETSSLNTFGVCTENYGVWLLNGSLEYVNGGPTKLRGTVQYDDLNFNANETHGQDGDAAPDQTLANGEVWEKIYGPYLIYANSGSDHDSLWADAQARGAEVVEEWPHAWVAQDESLYPRNRGAISGQLTAPGQSTANAQIIVCDNASIDWVWQGAMNYIYWTEADADGRFTVPKVNPGTYSVFAYAPGVVGDFQMDNIVVSAGATNNIGAITWNAPIREQVLFRLGSPDRSSEEFRFGDLPKQFGLWFRYLEEVGAAGSVDYTVGTGDLKTDWYYAQPVVAADNGTYVAPTFNVHFNLDSVPSGTCTLTVGLTGSTGSGAFNVYVNGNTDNVMPDAYHGQYTLDDSALDRDATVRGQQQVYTYTFNPNLLHVGENTVKITVRKTGDSIWSGSRPVVPAYGIMYDYVQLEAGSLTDTPLPTAPTHLAATGVSSSQIDLTWTASVAVKSYNIKRAELSGGPYSIIASAISATGYSDNSITENETYYYTVSAVNEFGESTDSAVASTMAIDVVPPEAPTGLHATAGDGSVLLEWTANDEPDLDRYTVYRAATIGTNYSMITTDIITTSYTDTTVTNGTTYYYVVTATDTNANESENSSVVSGTPHAGIYYENGFEAGVVGYGDAEQGGSGTPVDIDGAGTAYTTVFECGDFFGGAGIENGVVSGMDNVLGMWIDASSGSGNGIWFFDLGAPLSTGNGTTVQVDFTVGRYGARPVDDGTLLVELYDGLPNITDNNNVFTPNSTPLASHTVIISSAAYYSEGGGSYKNESITFNDLVSTSDHLFLAITPTDTSAGGPNLIAAIDNVAVVQINQAPLEGSYEAWIADYPGVGVLTSLTDNPDGDALNNLCEFAMGGNPNDSSDTGHSPTNMIFAQNSTNWFYYIYPKRIDAAEAGLTYSIEWTANLTNNWTNAFYEVTGTGIWSGAEAEFMAVTNRISTDVADTQFLKLNIELSE